MGKKRLKVRVSKKTFSGKNENISAFETLSLTQKDILIDKKSNLSVPDLSNVMETKKFSEEHQE